MKTRVTIAAIAAGVLIGVGVYSWLCACVTLVEIAHGRLRTEIHRVLDAERAFAALHGRFARTLDELAYAADSTIRLTLVATSDSTINIGGAWLEVPNVTCTLEVTPTTRTVDALLCTR